MATEKKTATKKTTKAAKKVTTKTSPEMEMKSIHEGERETMPEQLPLDEKHEERVGSQAEATLEAARANPVAAEIFNAERDVDAPGSIANRGSVSANSGTEYQLDARPGDLVPDKTFAVGEPLTEEAKVDRYDIAQREADATASIFGVTGGGTEGGYRGHGDKQDEWDRLERTRQEYRGKEDAEALEELAKREEKGETRLKGEVWYADVGQKLQSQGHSIRSMLGKYFDDMKNDQEKRNKISDIMNANQDLVKAGKAADLFKKL